MEGVWTPPWTPEFGPELRSRADHSPVGSSSGRNRRWPSKTVNTSTAFGVVYMGHRSASACP